MKNKLKISILIIGYNTKEELRALLPTINLLKVPNSCTVEIIYIDDGSTDQSYNYFNNQKLLFEKKSFCYKTNQGRVVAMQKAIDLCFGEWGILIQSNVVLNSQLIIEYYNSIMNNPKALAWMGQIKYESNDSIFTNYLNHKRRGSNQYKNNHPIHYQHLLFGNCCIHKSVIETIRLNLELTFYGGEELDFAYRVNMKYPNNIFMCSNAVVVRKNFPDFSNHCKKLEEFGEKNFKYLNKKLQQKVIKFPALLNLNYIFHFSPHFIYNVTLFLYKFNLPTLNYHIIRLGMLSSILAGYYKRIK